MREEERIEKGIGEIDLERRAKTRSKDRFIPCCIWLPYFKITFLYHIVFVLIMFRNIFIIKMYLLSCQADWWDGKNTREENLFDNEQLKVIKFIMVA